MSSQAQESELRASYKWFAKISTRWIDVDVYGHVNNVQYYSYFDTAVAEHLIEYGNLDPQTATIVGLVAETKCNFKKSIKFPATVNAGLRVIHIGKSSVKYEIGLFVNEDRSAAATGHFVHVYVNKSTQVPTPIPIERRQAIEMLLIKQ
jgi:acyl-CoA thioester hydrolase